jgi:hypothetical protein
MASIPILTKRCSIFTSKSSRVSALGSKSTISASGYQDHQTTEIKWIFVKRDSKRVE